MAQYSVNRQTHFNTSNSDLHEIVMLADKDGNVINSFAAASNIPIAAGLVAGYSNIHKFGRNPSVGGAPETVWQNGGIYSYLSAASTVYVSAVDATNDNPTGTGARTVTVQGLDTNYNIVEETLSVNNTEGSVEFLRVFRAFVATVGSILTNDDIIKISTGAGGTGTLLATIGIIGTGTTFGLGQTQLALYTIPAGKTGYLTNWQVGGGTYNDSITATLLARELDGANVPFRSRDIMDVPGGFHTRDYSVPYRFPEKTDIEVRAIASTGSIVSSSFDIILVDNE